MNLPWIRILSVACVIAMLPVTPAAAQDEDENIVVTGMRVRQGGAQDIKHFRSIADNDGMPRPESLTVEGLFGEHDLTLPAAESCAKLFCIVSETMPAQLAGRADHHLLIHKKQLHGRTVSRVVPLEEPALRKQELARMLSGVEVTREALGAAEALVRSANRSLKSVLRRASGPPAEKDARKSA